jgi:hypothetical protein
MLHTQQNNYILEWLYKYNINYSDEDIETDSNLNNAVQIEEYLKSQFDKTISITQQFIEDCNQYCHDHNFTNREFKEKALFFIQQHRYSLLSYVCAKGGYSTIKDILTYSDLYKYNIQDLIYTQVVRNNFSSPILLEYILKNQDHNILKLFLDKIDIHHQRGFYSPIQYILRYGNQEHIQLLIDHIITKDKKINIKYPNNKSTWLHDIVQNPNPNIISTLLQHIDISEIINDSKEYLNSYGNTFWHNITLIKMLKGNNAHLQYNHTFNQVFLRDVLEHYKRQKSIKIEDLLNIKNQSQKTFFQELVSSGNLNNVKAFIQTLKEFDVDLKKIFQPTDRSIDEFTAHTEMLTFLQRENKMIFHPKLNLALYLILGLVSCAIICYFCPIIITVITEKLSLLINVITPTL